MIKLMQIRGVLEHLVECKMERLMKIDFYENIDDKLLGFAVIVAKSFGKWVFCKHKERDTYEIPGGHRELGEDILRTAMRELYEETGAIDYDIRKLCAYSVEGSDEIKTYGMLYYADIIEFEDELNSEIEKIELFDSLPKENWTYPDIQPELVKKFLEKNIESLVAVKALVKNDEKILLLLKTDEEAGADELSAKIDLPGGRIFQNESPVEGLKREINEETSLFVRECKEINKNTFELPDGKVLKFLYYECTVQDNSVILSDEHEKYTWKSVCEILNNKSVPEWIKQLII